MGLAQYAANRFAIGSGAPSAKKSSPMLNTPGMDKLIQKAKVWLQDFF